MAERGSLLGRSQGAPARRRISSHVTLRLLGRPGRGHRRQPRQLEPATIEKTRLPDACVQERSGPLRQPTREQNQGDIRDLALTSLASFSQAIFSIDLSARSIFSASCSNSCLSSASNTSTAPDSLNEPSASMPGNASSHLTPAFARRNATLEQKSTNLVDYARLFRPACSDVRQMGLPDLIGVGNLSRRRICFDPVLDLGGLLTGRSENTSPQK
jgi:hypothetical protein